MFYITSLNTQEEINSVIKKNHMMLPIDAEMALEKIQHSFMKRSLSKIRI